MVQGTMYGIKLIIWDMRDWWEYVVSRLLEKSSLKQEEYVL